MICACELQGGTYMTNKISPIVKVGTTAGAITVILMTLMTDVFNYEVSATLASAMTVLITQGLAWFRGPGE